ncbi:50S ribosomal protein L21 [Consotaella aegiceratis]|uniref:50S ribosomal protein L21 n=1 Tax=Consotaella aegiceratis TaxID=3097961 RepID=UPI002F3E3C2B
MFAVIKTGGKQYRVAPEDQFTIERIPGNAGDSVTFGEVLMVDSTVGAPLVDGASVTAEIVEQTRGKKVISFKKRRRQNSKRSRGHRQDLTLIKISEILTGGKKAAPARSRKKAEAEAAADENVEAAAPATASTESVAEAEATEATKAPAKKPRAPRKTKSDDTDTGGEA